LRKPSTGDWTAKQKEEHLQLFNAPVMQIITIHEAFPGHVVISPPKRKLLPSLTSSPGRRAAISYKIMDETKPEPAQAETPLLDVNLFTMSHRCRRRRKRRDGSRRDQRRGWLGVAGAFAPAAYDTAKSIAEAKIRHRPDLLPRPGQQRADTEHPEGKLVTGIKALASRIGPPTMGNLTIFTDAKVEESPSDDGGGKA
jgi:hypothetical protein